MERTHWRVCRREGCQRALSGVQQVQGFCDSNCQTMYAEEKEFHIRKAEEFLQKQCHYFEGAINA